MGEKTLAEKIKGLIHYNIIPQLQDILTSITNGFKTIKFTDLTDVPVTYTGQGGKVVSVKSDGTGLEFTTPSTSIESQVKIVATNGLTDFSKAHGTLVLDGKMFIGTRANGVDAPVLICYPDKNNLSVFTKIEMPLAGAGVNGIENMCYDSVNDKIYATLSNTTKIIEVNPADITDYTIHTITMTNSTTFGNSSACLTDGTHIYVGCEMIPTGRFVKIQISDFTQVANVAWTGHSGPHAGCGATMLSNGYAYFTNNGTNCYLAKVDISDLSYTEVDTGLNGLTDDIAFCDGEANQTFTNYVICASESYTDGVLGGAIIDVDNMVVYPMSILPSVGVFYDPIENRVYSTSINGYIERWEFSDINLYVISGSDKDQRGIMDVFTMRGYMPNEMLLHTDPAYVNPTEIFVTIWEDYNTPQTGKLKKIELNKVINTTITKQELLYRFAN